MPSPPARRWLRRARLALLLTASAACGHDYIYAPTVATSATVAGLPASYYQIPPEAPRGDVQLATFGFADIAPVGARDSAGTLRAIHMRMIVANNSDQPWQVDTREQRIELPNAGESRPAYVTAGRGSAPPIIDIPPGQARTIDLFYPLPQQLQEESHLPAFDTIWTVHTSTRPVVERTPFERLTVEPRYVDPYWYYGWGPPYWFDPFYYPYGAFVGVQFTPTYVHHPVVIRPYHAVTVRHVH